MKTTLLAAALLAASWAGAADVENGKKIFTAKCSSCHGKDASGNKAMAKMFKTEPATLDFTDAYGEKWDEVIAKGRKAMPKFEGKLKPEEITDVLAFLKTVSAVDGAALYKKNCASCHAADGKGSAAMAKMFKAEPASLDLVGAATLAKSDEDLVKLVMDGKGKMPAYKGKLNEAQAKAIVAYFKSLGAPKEEPKK